MSSVDENRGKDRFKTCKKCKNNMNVLDNHDECYLHRICGKDFPCDFCKHWDDDRRSLVEKMIEKSKEKAKIKGDKSLCGGGLPVKDVSPSVKGAIPNARNLNPSVRIVQKESSCTETCAIDDQAVQIDISAIIEQQVKQQLESMFKKQSDLNSNYLNNQSSSLGGESLRNNVDVTPQASSRPHFDKFRPFDDQNSVIEDENVSVHAACDLSVMDHNEQQSDFGTNDIPDNMTSVEIPYGAPDSSDPLQWHSFIQKMATVLNIDLESEEAAENERTSYISSRLKNDKEIKKALPKLPLEGTIIDIVRSVEKEATAGHLKNRSVRGRDDKAFMVKKDDFNEFCMSPKLDDNIEEGLVVGQKKGNFNNRSKVHVPPFHKELDNDFRRIDNSARAMFRAISYGTMISAFLDEADCEDDRVVGRKALINCFRSMADLTGRIMANSVMCRRKVFLRNVDFISKATEQKLLRLPMLGNQLFNGQYFNTLHTSAENLRDARETQNVYSNTSFDKSYKNKDDRKRKIDSLEQHSASKYAKTTPSASGNSNHFHKKDNFRFESARQDKKDHFSRKQGGVPKGFSSQKK